jgi:hypothetical protein
MMAATKNIHPIIRQIVGNCHVGQSNLSVIRHVISKLREGHKTYRSMPRGERRKMVKQIVSAHSENISLYNHVMRGQRTR